MWSEELFERVLIDPAKKTKSNRLLIVSGYATANMAGTHLAALKKAKLAPAVSLIVGMAHKDGMDKAQHKRFVGMSDESPYGCDFSCHYVVKNNPVHAKVFCWMRGDEPTVAFVGSANYSFTGFSKSQIEAVTCVDPHSAKIFYDKNLRNTKNCTYKKIKNKISFYDRVQVARVKGAKGKSVKPSGETVMLSLLVSRTGETHNAGGGINWGQPTATRKRKGKDEAYIPFPVHIQKSAFFPPRARQFVVVTDDDRHMNCVVAQERGKAIETPDNNAFLGRYLRERIGVSSGEYVTREHLEKYGRTDVEFTKINDDTYYMDFGVKNRKRRK